MTRPSRFLQGWVRSGSPTVPPVRAWRWGTGAACAGLALLVVLSAQPARALDGIVDGPTAASDLLDLPALVLGAAAGRLIGGSGPSGYLVHGGPPSGFLFGVDVGVAIPIAGSGVESEVSVALGARVGYQFPNGLSATFCYQDLGLNPDLVDGAQLQFATLNVRYTFPYIFPMPFVEGMAGLSFATASGALAPGQGSVSVGAGGALGLGASFPLSHHVAIDVGVRDWLAPISGELFQVIAIQAGASFAFGGPARP